MEAYKMHKYGLSHLKKEKQSLGALKAGQVCVDLYATSINSADMDMVKGSIFGRFSGLLRPKYKVPGSDLAGKVAAVGPGVENLKVGDRVYGDMSEEGFACFARQKIVRAGALTKMPPGMDFISGAALPSAGVIALQAMEKQTLTKDSHVCINGCGGGMGTLCLQVAKAKGAYVVAVDSAYKRDTLMALKADAYVDYRVDKFTRGDLAYDLIVDCQSHHKLKAYLGILKAGGVYTMVGGSIKSIIGAAIFSKSLSKKTGKSLGLLLGQMNHLQRMQTLGDLWTKGDLKPIIDRVYDFDDFIGALEHFESGNFVGKIVVKIREEH